jgi:hypothetical protein
MIFIIKEYKDKIILLIRFIKLLHMRLVPENNLKKLMMNLILINKLGDYHQDLGLRSRITKQCKESWIL